MTKANPSTDGGKSVVSKRQRIRVGEYQRYVKSGAWKYNERYDAYYSVRTRKWVEEKCSDKTCQFCARRPSRAPR